MSVFKGDVLAGRVALITGGGTGICKGIARAYLRHGARVCITSRKREALAAAVEELSRETGGEVMYAQADVRAPEQLDEAVAATVARFGSLDTLVNGAAGNFLAPAAALSPKGFRTVVEIDLQGTFNACKAAFAALSESGRGVILNISATLHYFGTPLQIHASCAKAGVDALTRNLAVEWSGVGLRVNAIAPGPIAGTVGVDKLVPSGMGERVTSQIPMGRFGTVDEVASLAVYLTTEAASYITGAIFVIDGGQSTAALGLLGAGLGAPE
ncbi:MAG: SDR family oxidoreductase [Myxococcales bacterium]|nr:SDR family oxidoreductase [Myxococcales bacterium]